MSIVPVPPNAVRVWRGFAAPSRTRSEVLSFLGSIYIPLEAQVRPAIGMTAYLSAAPLDDKPASVPDELALIFYESQAVYEQQLTTNNGRVYGTLPAAFFAADAKVTPTSQSGYPILLAGSAVLDQPHYLFERDADWQCGAARLLTGARPMNRSEDDLLRCTVEILSAVQACPPVQLQAAIVVVSTNYLAYWELWEQTPPSTASGPLGALSALLDRPFVVDAAPRRVAASFDEPNAGLDFSPGTCINLQFDRRLKPSAP